MKLLHKLTLVNLLCFSTIITAADLVENQYDPSKTPADNGAEMLAKYVLNLGGYLGYDLKQSPTDKQNVTGGLLDISTLMLSQTNAFSTFLGSIPVDAISQAMQQFLPSTVPAAALINDFANATYLNYNNPSSTGSASVTITPLLDQPTFQKDPVSQTILNILTTPDYTSCQDYSGTWKATCPRMYQDKIMANVIGKLPPYKEVYSFEYNEPLLGQLNSNALMGPLLYSTEGSSQQPEATGTPNQQDKGLTAQNQLQQASNFILYATGAVSPGSLPKFKDYDSLLLKAKGPSNAAGKPPTAEQLRAQNTLNTYFTSLRVYAAQSSVGVSNLYYILAKRLPQNPSKNATGQVSSQAMNEFKMATWRLFNTEDANPDKQWAKQINDASPATVQKEIATLLAEINYQMYLDRQIQERILLTNSIGLIQNSRMAQPKTDFSTQDAGQ